MLNIIFLILSIIILIILGFFLLSHILFRNYPLSILFYSDQEHPDNVFYYNGKKVGDHRGFWKRFRREKTALISLKRGDLMQEIRLKRGFSPPFGDDLGLRCVGVNDKPKLKEKYLKMS